MAIHRINRHAIHRIAIDKINRHAIHRIAVQKINRHTGYDMPYAD